MGIEFLGNKRQLEEFIIGGIKEHTDATCKKCLDAFSGSGSVSAAFKKNGYSVYANDFLAVSFYMTEALLLNNEAPLFEKVIEREKIECQPDPYQAVLDYLNALEGTEGFIFKNYSPASKLAGNVERMYFTEQNAKKIDAIRIKISEWDSLLMEKEKALLLSGLVEAVSSVSNIAGTYGCYMKHWKKKALTDLRMKKTAIVPGKKDAYYGVTNAYINDIIEDDEYDIIYADPPYTKRQYSAYYHLLETIVLYDDPNLDGSTGLRNWKEKSSDFCYKRKAPQALQYLVDHARCRYFVLSYNDEGQISHERIMEILRGKGTVAVKEAPYKRYKSNNAKNQRKDVVERLYILRMEQEG